MKFRKVAEIGATLCAATAVGLGALKSRCKQAEPKKPVEPKNPALRAYPIALSLIAAALALWEIKKHHHVSA